MVGKGNENINLYCNLDWILLSEAENFDPLINKHCLSNPHVHSRGR